MALRRALEPCKHGGCLTETPELLFWRNAQPPPFFLKGSATLGAFIADPEFFVEGDGSEKLLPSVIKAGHASIPLLGYCLDQTEVSLWSRQTRDKKVSGRTLASLGISFTGVKEAPTLIRQQIGAMCSDRQQNSRCTAWADRAALVDEHAPVTTE